MPSVSGWLRDFGLDALLPSSPILLFCPSGPGITSDGSVLSSTPIKATLGAGGNFVVSLASNDDVTPETWYTLRIAHFDAWGNYQHMDFPEWKIHVPAAGGNIGDLIQGPWYPASIWVGDTPPPGPFFWNTYWLYTGPTISGRANGDVLRWEF